MSVLVNVILAVQMLAALGMIGLILVQHGKGADMGAAFGSGSSGSLFGASGSANFLSRSTAVWQLCFLSLHWHWPTLAMPVQPALVACWRPLLLLCPLVRPLRVVQMLYLRLLPHLHLVQLRSLRNNPH